jgi:hypothetical protein
VCVCGCVCVCVCACVCVRACVSVCCFSLIARAGCEKDDGPARAAAAVSAAAAAMGEVAAELQANAARLARLKARWAAARARLREEVCCACCARACVCVRARGGWPLLCPPGGRPPGLACFNNAASAQDRAAALHAAGEAQAAVERALGPPLPQLKRGRGGDGSPGAGDAAAAAGGGTGAGEDPSIAALRAHRCAVRARLAALLAPQLAAARLDALNTPPQQLDGPART